MYYLFLLMSIIPIWVSLTKRREFDFISLYILCLFLFNLPTFFGVVYDVRTSDFVKITDPFMYFCSSIPFIFATPFLFLKTKRNRVKRNVLNYESIRMQTFALYLILIICVLGIYDNRIALFGARTKVEFLENSTKTAVLLFNLPIIGVLLSYKLKKNIFLISFVLIVFLLFFSGSRSPLAFLGICLFIDVLYMKEFRIINYFKFILLGSSGLLVIILGKRLYGVILYRGFFEGLSVWWEDFNIDYLRQGSEFLGTSLILNEVIERSFTISSLDIFLSMYSILPIPVSYWGHSSSILMIDFNLYCFLILIIIWHTIFGLRDIVGWVFGV